MEISNSHLTQLKINGIELITQKQVFHNGENGLEEVNCPNCKANNIENNWSAMLENWYEETKPDQIKCKYCEAENSVTKFEFKPTWAFGNFGITFWNWNLLKPKFITELEKIIGTELKIVHGKL